MAIFQNDLMRARMPFPGVPQTANPSPLGGSQAFTGLPPMANSPVDPRMNNNVRKAQPKAFSGLPPMIR